MLLEPVGDQFDDIRSADLYGEEYLRPVEVPEDDETDSPVDYEPDDEEDLE